MGDIELRIPSDHSVLEPLQLFIEGVGRSYGVEEEELSSLSIAVIELVKNGMEHGNDMDPDRRVTIAIARHPAMLQFTIDDEGCWEPDEEPGFCPAEGDELLSCRGRGVLIARNLARWVEYGLSPEGRTRVKLVWPLT